MPGHGFARGNVVGSDKMEEARMKVRWVIFLLAASFCNLASSDEVCSRVVKVGQCWSGFNAVIVEMENGDKLWLGDLAGEPTKARLSMALTSSVSGQLVCYQKATPQLICSVQRSSPDWWVVGGSVW